MKKTMQPRSHPDLLKGSINQNIIRMSLPMMVAMLFQTGFSVIDMIFVGMVGPEALAAVSIVFPVMFFFISFIMGIGTGLSSFVARTFGAGEIEKAGRIAANGLVFGIVLSLLLMVFGLFAVGLPAAVYLQMSQGLNGVWLGLSLANLSGTIAAYAVYWWRFPKGG